MKGPLDTEESRKRWNAFAEKFAERVGESEMGDPLRQAVLTPAMLETIGDIAGLRVLDAGCGEGYLSRLLAKLGGRVTAFDYSEEMVRLARERTPPDLGIDYCHGNAERLQVIDDAIFDIVVSNFVLIDLDDYRAAIGEAYRVLRPGGRLILSVPHPCFMTPSCGWERDGDGRKLHWNVDRYFDEGPHEERVLLKHDNVLIQFHRTLTSYVRALIGTGFVLEDLIEGKPTEEAIAEGPGWRDDLRMTHVIVFDCRKPASPTQ